MAQSHIYRRFAWQAWDRWHWVAPLGRDWAPVTPRHFAWQAWHNLTSTVVSRGRRGTKSHLPSFCVAGMAQMALGGTLGPGLGACDAAPLCVAGVAQPDIHRRFTWQAWHKLTSNAVLRGRHGTDALGGALGPGLGACDAAPLCVAGVAQPDIPRASACLILACLIFACLITFFCRPVAFHTHTHTSGQVLVLLVVERQG